MLDKGYLCAVVTQDAWQTPTTNMDMVRSEEGVQKRIAFRASIGRKSIPDGNLGEQMQRLHGQAAPANPSTDGSRQGLWPTITAHTPDMESSGPNGHSGTYLAGAVKSWATPNAFCYQPPENTEQWTKRAEYQQTEKGVNLHKPVQSQVLHENEKVMGAMPPSAGKLNPRWVETLMGLPVGWTMPSCKLPVTTAPTNCASSATESCLQQQSEHSELFGRNSND
jgi:hypothetical protein